MRILHVIESLSPSRGGPPAVVVNLAGCQAKWGMDVSIATRAHPELAKWWVEWQQKVPCAEHIQIQAFPPRSLREIQRNTATADIVHVHGVWDSLVYASLRTRSKCSRARLVLAPHGMLSKWSMEQKRWKKSIALALVWRKLLNGIDAFHVLNDAERTEICNQFPSAKLFQLPNGVGTESCNIPEPTTQDIRLLPTGKPYILFLARLHHMKGVDRLLRAYAEGTRAGLWRDVDLIIAGPDFGELQRVRRYIDDTSLAQRVHYVGEVSGGKKWLLVKRAACLCQPSRYEGFSVTLIESLACGIPIVITPEANFREAEQRGAALVAEGDSEELMRALALILSNADLRVKMGAAGARMVRDHYTWERICEQSLNCYASLSTSRAVSKVS